MRKITREAAIDQAVKTLVDVARPSRIILFGSSARGEAGEESDLDFLVVLKHVEKRRAESARLHEALGTLPISADVLVATEDQVYEWGNVVGTVLHEALTEGKVVYEAA